VHISYEQKWFSKFARESPRLLSGQRALTIPGRSFCPDTSTIVGQPALYVRSHLTIMDVRR
jgi:hypothetical protein